MITACVMKELMLNSFHGFFTGLFVYSLKTSENQMFRRYRKNSVAWLTGFYNGKYWS